MFNTMKRLILGVLLLLCTLPAIVCVSCDDDEEEVKPKEVELNPDVLAALQQLNDDVAALAEIKNTIENIKVAVEQIEPLVGQLTQDIEQMLKAVKAGQLTPEQANAMLDAKAQQVAQVIMANENMDMATKQKVLSLMQKVLELVKLQLS